MEQSYRKRYDSVIGQGLFFRHTNP